MSKLVPFKMISTKWSFSQFFTSEILFRQLSHWHTIFLAFHYLDLSLSYRGISDSHFWFSSYNFYSFIKINDLIFNFSHPKINSFVGINFCKYFSTYYSTKRFHYSIEKEIFNSFRIPTFLSFYLKNFVNSKLAQMHSKFIWFLS